MAKDIGNKGIYIFWGGILLIIAIVLLIIFVPRTETKNPFTNLNSVINTVNEKDSNQHDFSYYMIHLQTNNSIDTERNKKIESLNKMLGVFTSSNAFNQSALLFLENGSGFKSLSTKHTGWANDSKNAIDEFNIYIKNSLNPFLSGNYSTTDIAMVVDVVVQKYSNVIVNLSEFYLSTAEIIHNYAVRGLDVKESIINSSLELMQDAKTEALNIQNNTFINFRIKDFND